MRSALLGHICDIGSLVHLVSVPSMPMAQATQSRLGISHLFSTHRSFRRPGVPVPHCFRGILDHSSDCPIACSSLLSDNLFNGINKSLSGSEFSLIQH